jgi:hypothetical protein
VVLLVSHPPHRRTPTAKSLPSSSCAAQAELLADSAANVTPPGE